MNGLFTLTKNDFLNGLIMLVGSTVVSYLLQVISAPGFDFGSIDWHEIVRITFVAVITYLGKKFLSDNQGNTLGIVGGK